MLTILLRWSGDRETLKDELDRMEQCQLPEDFLSSGIVALLGENGFQVVDSSEDEG